ncbi:MAG: hypothetical protein HYR60_21175 [Acidobacteria bacterium]|nr:hypothetical protein [Acidobacteriota bacterium]
MSRLAEDERQRLLPDLAKMGSQGRAENEDKETFRQTFYPVAEHVRAFDPDVVLVVGARGAGKSELFRAAVVENLLPAVLRVKPGTRLGRLDLSHTTWLPAHPLGRDFADHAGLRRFFAGHERDHDAEVDLWFAYLVRVLRGTSQELQFTNPALLDSPGGDVEAIVGAFRELRNEPLLALDRLDRDLEESNRWIIVGYDELDILGGYDWEAMVRSIRGLVAFWANYARRWSRIRAKIFLRTDLFRRHGQSFGADLSKLAANRAEIIWSDRNLYAMLVKRIANSSDSLRAYCEQSRLRFTQDPDLGSLPQLAKAEDARPFIEKLAGQYMGADLKKGRTFHWLLSHVRDGNGHAMPRALVRLVEEAAQQELERPLAAYNRLLDPRSLRRALDVVSKEHVLQVNTHELPWLPGVAERMDGQGVPMPRQNAEKSLSRDWEGWSKSDEKVHPPAQDSAALVDYLLEIGVFRQRSERRIDAPDLFLAGLGMSRKGGVRKR